jgi:hypothetical protein
MESTISGDVGGLDTATAAGLAGSDAAALGAADGLAAADALLPLVAGTVVGFAAVPPPAAGPQAVMATLVIAISHVAR